MSQIRLTNQERIQALERLGYAEREAGFLCLAGLHGGYFLRRQYSQFLDKSVGGTAAALIEKVLAKGHAKGTIYATNTHIYHLCARPFYAALGQEDNRNRRLREPTTIKNKLMVLDFILAHPEHEYLATEQEKIDYFTGTLQLDRLLLPTKRYASQGQVTERYFVEKFPIFLSASTEAAQPAVVSFCFVDEGMVGLSGFGTFLQQYSALLSNLREFQVIYVAATDTHFQAAKGLFERSAGPLSRSQHAASGDAFLDRLLEHFEARRLHEMQQWAAFDRAKLIRFRDERQEFSGEKFEAFYKHWNAGGAAALRAVLNPQSRSVTPGHGSFLTYRLEQNYDFFGNAIAC
jgi:hypothetical protein